MAFACAQPQGDSASNPPPTDQPPQDHRPPLPNVGDYPVLEDMNADPFIVEVNLTAGFAMHEFVAGKRTEVYAYNGATPGPLIMARVGDRIIVHFKNELGEATTVHWHGLRISDEMDGTPRMQEPIPSGGTFTYDFVVPDAGSFWFHPHFNSVEQIERGLMGAIIVHEAEPPVFDRERILFTDDVRLNSTGSIAQFQISGMDIMHGRAGDILLLNGQSAPAPVTVKAGTRERWRIFNSANARTMELSLEGATFRVIGTDGGLIHEPYETSRLMIAVGQRFDLDVTFDGAPGSEARLMTHVLALNAQNEVVEVSSPLQIFQYGNDAAQAVREITLPAVDALQQPLSIRPVKSLSLSGFNDATGVHFTINEHVYPNEEHWEVEAIPMQVEISNELGMEHPFHLHGQFFKIVSPPSRAEAEPGLKDTVLVGGGERVVILIYWNNLGDWMYHCHINEHAEGGMMGHVHVIAAD